MSNPIIHTKPDEHIVCFFATRNLYDVLPAAFHSMLAYNPDVHVYLFIEDDSLPYMLPGNANITTVNVSNQTFFNPDGPSFRTKYTYMVLMKTTLSKIFPDASRAVIVDVDTITCASISELWTMDISHAYYAAVLEPRGSQIRGVPYANWGVVLLNLDKLRSSGKDDLVIEELNTHYFRYPEQDAFNKVCGNRFDPLPPDYNVTKNGFDITGDPKRTIIRHFAGYHAQDWGTFPIVQYWLHHTTPQPRIVVYAGNRKYYPNLIASAKSLLCHSPVDKIYFLIEDDTIQGETLPDLIECVNVSHQTVFPEYGPNVRKFYSYMTTLRAGLTHILPDIPDRVLWLDPDVVVTRDISDIWSYDIDKYYFAAVQEVRNHNHTRLPYYNAGVMLMNLRKLDEDGMSEQIINDINTTPYEHLEQDALNFNCSPYILDLPSKYNYSFVSALSKEPPCIIHYLSHAKQNLTAAQQPYVRMAWNQIRYVQNPDR